MITKEKHSKKLKTLFEEDEDGKYIFNAGVFWDEFDFDKGLDELIEKDKDGYCIFNAGIYWSEFNFEKAIKYITKDHLKIISKCWKLNSLHKIQLLSRLI